MTGITLGGAPCALTDFIRDRVEDGIRDAAKLDHGDYAKAIRLALERDGACETLIGILRDAPESADRFLAVRTAASMSGETRGRELAIMGTWLSGKLETEARRILDAEFDRVVRDFDETERAREAELDAADRAVTDEREAGR